MLVLITADKQTVLVLSSFCASRSSLKIFTALTVLRDELLKEVGVDCEEFLEHKNTLCGTNEGFIVLIMGTNTLTRRL